MPGSETSKVEEPYWSGLNLQGRGCCFDEISWKPALKARGLADLSSTSASESFAITATEAASRGSIWLSIF